MRDADVMKLPFHQPVTLIFRTLVSVTIVAMVFFCASDLLACPTCKDGLAENDPASQVTAAGYFYSILFMMAMPFVLIGTFGSAAYFSIRRARQKLSDSDQSADKSA